VAGPILALVTGEVRRIALRQQGDHTAAAHEWAARAIP
jgi:hypothetical protein